MRWYGNSLRESAKASEKCIRVIPLVSANLGANTTTVCVAELAEQIFHLLAAHHQGLNSRDLVELRFRNCCGTALTFEETTRPEQVDITVGSLDEPNDLSPENHIWTSSLLN